jgi:ABC-type lipoprotein release transport system permease subunit
LRPQQLGAGAAVTLALTVGTSAIAGWQIARIAPAELLRDT